MIITSLRKMEDIVSQNNNLHWDGWTVVETKQSDAAKTAINGLYRNGKWFLARHYAPNRNGWDIPSRYYRS